MPQDAPFRCFCRASKNYGCCSKCRLDNWRGHIKIDPSEVQAIRWVALEGVYAAVQKDPHEFTSWLRGELELLRGSLQSATARQEMPLQRMAEGTALQLA